MAAVALGSLFHYVMKGRTRCQGNSNEDDGSPSKTRSRADAMIRKPKDLQRYTPRNGPTTGSWASASSCSRCRAWPFPSGLLPARAAVRRRRVWARILHPFIGVMMAVLPGHAFRFKEP